MQITIIDQFLQRFFWSCILGMAAFTVHFLQSLNTQITELNQKMVVVVEKLVENEKDIERHDQRIRRLENTTERHRQMR